MWNIKIENTLQAIKCLIGNAYNEIHKVEDKLEAFFQD